MSDREIRLVVLCGLLMLLVACGQKEKQTSLFEKEELQWRAQRDKNMKSPTSWLTIAGLFWLKEGENTFGSADGNDIRLPAGSAPAQVGRFILHNRRVKVVVKPKTGLLFQKKPITEMELKSDAEDKPDILELNDLRLWVIERGERLAIRLRDLNAPAFKNYTGLHFYPPKPEYRLKGLFVPYPEVKIVRVATIVGTEAEYQSPGYVRFHFNGEEYHLMGFSTSSGPDRLFFIFKDETNGEETYGSSRFLVARRLEDGSVDLNFNRAYNPPCAYTPYATCPLAPPENYLPVKIEAGEKKYGHGHE